MPFQLRMSQLVLAVLEGLLLQFLMKQTWRGWTSLVRMLAGSIGLTGTLQQVRGGGIMGAVACLLFCLLHLQ